MNYLFEKFKEFETKDAIVVDEITYSYASLLEQINIYKSILEKEIKPSSVVAILGDYSFYNIALFFALFENKN